VCKQLGNGGYLKTQLSFILFIILTTTCFGYCGLSSGHKNIQKGDLLMTIHCILLLSIHFLWPEDGPEWSKHVVVSIINRIQRQLCFDVPNPY